MSDFTSFGVTIHVFIKILRELYSTTFCCAIQLYITAHCILLWYTRFSQYFLQIQIPDDVNVRSEHIVQTDIR